MQLSKCVILTAILLILALAQRSLAQSAAIYNASSIVNGQLGREIDTRLSAFAEKGFSGVVLVAQGDQILLAKGYGFADREQGLAYTTDTVFDIGSITKPFTASAIMKLQADGKLTVTDPITKYFEGVPDDKAEITIHHLLTHTAGFTDSLGGDYQEVSREDFVEVALASKLRSRPGNSYSYSNVGYSLLGAIIERATGAPYEQYLHEKLFKPSGMTKTGYRIPSWEKGELARGYKKDKDWGTPLDRAWADDGPYWHLRANGGLLSTANDLYRWAIVLRGDGVLDEATKREQFKPQVREGLFGGGNQYGYGWSIGKTRQDKPVWEHNGSNGIFFADFRIYPDDQLVLILATNASGLRYMSELSKISNMVLAEPRK